MFKNIKGTHAGAAVEVYAASVLMGWGFLVYKNLAPHGAHDLVVMRQDDFKALPVDITLGRWRVNSYQGDTVLASLASQKLQKGSKHTVIVVAETGELWLASEVVRVPEKTARYKGEVAVTMLPLSPDVILARFEALK